MTSRSIRSCSLANGSDRRWHSGALLDYARRLTAAGDGRLLRVNLLVRSLLGQLAILGDKIRMLVRVDNLLNASSFGVAVVGRDASHAVSRLDVATQVNEIVLSQQVSVSSCAKAR